MRTIDCARLPKYEELQTAHVVGAHCVTAKSVRHETASAQPLHTKNRPSAKQAEYLRGTPSKHRRAAENIQAVARSHRARNAVHRDCI